MFARSLTVVLLAASTVLAWPIVFYPTNDCRSDPIAVHHEPPAPGQCILFDHHESVKSYSGETSDAIQKVLLYYSADTCVADAAHRVYSNHTINNTRNACFPFKNHKETPQAFTFIEELLPSPGNSSAADASCNAFRVQY